MGRSSVCEKTGLRKGSWSPEEDKVLKTYITNNGHGNWNELPKLAGLLRCGKSCRLRWKNYLDPTVKRGNFTKKEVDFIIEMHKLGYRWSKIASHLQGRTDNEIKNFYYTHLKKKYRDNDTPNRRRTKPAGKQFTIGEIQSSPIPILESSSIECPHIEEPERETLIQIYKRVWEEGLSKDPHFPIPPSDSEEKTYPWDCEDDYDIQGSSFGNVSPQHFGSSSSQPISSQTFSHSSSSMDKSKTTNGILEETEIGSLKQIYELVWEEGLSEDPHIPIPPSEEQTYPWDCDNEYDIQREPLLKIHGGVWEENLMEDPHIPDPVFEEQTSPWSSVNDYDNLTRWKFQIDSSSFTDESENESSIPEETERGSLKQVYECVRTAVMWARSLFGFNKNNCS